MYSREHHIRIANILQALDADLLLKCHCYFGGGTAIVLSNGEYRESADVDFLISDLKGYQALRLLLKEPAGINLLARHGMQLPPTSDLRIDQYGIRTMLKVGTVEIKFEIVLEGRIHFENPSPEDRVCGVAALSPLDLAASKLLANSDRWSDDGVFSRDLIDLAMLDISAQVREQAFAKATAAYGKSVERDLIKAIEKLGQRKGRLEECMSALKIDSLPAALLWSRIRALRPK